MFAKMTSETKLTIGLIFIAFAFSIAIRMIWLYQFAGYEMFQHFKDGIATPEEHLQMQIPRHALHAIGIFTPYKKQAKIISTIPKDLKVWISNNIEINVKALEKIVESEISPSILSMWYHSTF